MINYIVQVVLFQILFLTVYDLFLSKETFFTKNRWYLITTSILSFILPLIKISAFQQTVPKEFIIYLPEIVLSPEKVIQKTSWYQSINYVEILFWGGVVLFSLLFLVKIAKVFNLIFKYKVVKKQGFKIVLIPNTTKAFSFFNYIFLGENVPENQQEKIIKHELVHSKQKHSLDLLFFEILKIVMWFNPMVYLYQKRITLVHEFISDEVAVKSASRENYINSLLSNLFQVENIAFINQFYKQSIIKKRIIMMTKQQSKKMNQLKYLVLIPVLIAMLFYTSCSDTEIAKEANISKQIKTMYSKFGDKEIKEYKSKEMSYLDFYLGTEFPRWKEISYDDLSDEEKGEYNQLINKVKNSDYKFFNIINYKLFKSDKGRNVLASIFDLSKIEEKTEYEEISFMTIDKAPTFPGCESGNKECFSKKVQMHFAKNFDRDLLKTLNLSSGKKKVYIGFKIEKEGNVVDVNVRAPHPEIKDEVLKIMSSLPKMIPGENKGKKVVVKYAIPISIVVK